ncbi:Sperm motility kinase W [Fukomys damarensis]|uniref:Sperm motility kinase W n=1 Tax=Fukomys damarensis TaxID=885580 RepID=A0A091DA65_FUKDA|nr:Sperm motility kinase W [Fukomys damarensis]
MPNIRKLLNHNPTMRPTVQKVLKHQWIQSVRPLSPPELLPVPTKRAILSCMAGMGFDPLTVMDTLRRKDYNHEMATFLLLQSQAPQGLGLSNPVEPVREAAEKTLWPLTGPAPSFHIPRRRASEPAPCTGRLFPRVKPRGGQGGRGSQPPTIIQRTPTPACPSSLALPLPACPSSLTLLFPVCPASLTLPCPVYPASQALELPALAPEPPLPLPTVGVDAGRLSRGASQAAYGPCAAAACHPGAPLTLGGPKYRAMRSNSMDMDVLPMADPAT